MKTWNVYVNGKLYDTVFFQSALTSEEVKRSLILHDNYPFNITVKAAK